MAPRTVYANLPDGYSPLSQWDQSLSDMGLLGIIPCSVSGTNALTLTPFASAFAPNINTYTNRLRLSFVAAATSTGAVTAIVPTPPGVLPLLPTVNVFRFDGTQAGAGDIQINAFYDLVFDINKNGFWLVPITISTISGVSFPPSPSVNTVPVVTSTNTITYEPLPNSAMATMAANTTKGNPTGSSAVPQDVSPLTARSSSLLNIESSTNVGDASYTMLATDRIVYSFTAFTAARTWTFPATSSVNDGHKIVIFATGISATNTLTFQAAGADNIIFGNQVLSSFTRGQFATYTYIVFHKVGGSWIIDAYDSIGNNHSSGMLNQTIKANISGASAQPGDNTLTAILDNILGNAQGDIIYRNASNWTVLAPGTSGQFLQTQGPSANPQWAAPSTTYAKFSEQQASGTASASGVTLNTFVTQVLNTSEFNNIPSCSLSTNLISLPSGTYVVWASVQADTNNAITKLKFRDTTNSVDLVLGPAGQESGGGVAAIGYHTTMMYGVFTLSGTVSAALQVWSNATNANWMKPTAGAGVAEVYSQVMLTKIA